jgi:hypothetical protein
MMCGFGIRFPPATCGRLRNLDDIGTGGDRSGDDVRLGCGLIDRQVVKIPHVILRLGKIANN